LSSSGRESQLSLIIWSFSCHCEAVWLGGRSDGR